MNALRLPVVFFWLACLPSAHADQPAPVDRSVAQEPTYHSQSPGYALLLLGAEPKSRVWVVLDGNRLFIDRNGNGNLTERGECQAIKHLREAKSGLNSPVQLAADQGQARIVAFEYEASTRGDPVRATIRVEVRGKFRQYAYFAFADRADQAPIMHFDGPLAIDAGSPDDLMLFRDDSNDLAISLSTRYPGQSANVFVDAERGLATEVDPVIDVEFPGKEPGKSIRERQRLTHRC